MQCCTVQRGQHSPSPLSPTKISRTEEKRVLGYLNIRLASYILNLKRLEQQVGPSAYSCEKCPNILMALRAKVEELAANEDEEEDSDEDEDEQEEDTDEEDEEEEYSDED